MKRFVPLILLLVALAFVGWRLAAPERAGITSQLVGQAVPDIALPPALPGGPGIETLATGEPRFVNLFGSWCNPCIAEAPLLEALAEAGATIDGIAVRDDGTAVARFLATHGNPFERIGDDPDSQAMLALGATGVPETFLIDGEGIIRYHKQGPIEPDELPDLLARWEALQ